MTTHRSESRPVAGPGQSALEHPALEHPAEHPRVADPATCADYIPVDMREPAQGEALARQREEYLAYRRQLRRLFVRGWLALLVVWGIALAFVLAGADPESPEGSLAQGVTFLAPIALLGVIPFFYLRLRQRTRVDDFEETHEAAREDPYPSDRFVRATGPLVVVAALAVLGLMVLGFPWLFVSEGQLELQGAAIWTLVVLALVGALVARGRRTGVVATSDALVVTTFLSRRIVPWDGLSSFDVDVVETMDQQGTHRDLRLSIRAPGRLPSEYGWLLILATRGQRARARHNLRVAAQWSREHGKPIPPGLADGLRWADGDIAAEVLWHPAAATSST